MGIVLVITAVLLGFALAEYLAHARVRRAIGLRIHVNGTRGKSSVCRLIAAGLRAAGVRAVAKTTGTAARVIYEDGSEHPVIRAGPARIGEQLRIVRLAARRRADALVLECMAIQPFLQWLSEVKIVRAHVAVITNVRADHLDVMGPDVDGVAMALVGVTPAGGTLVARQSRYDAFFADECRRRSATLRRVGDEEVARITPAQLGRFRYVEHAENVAVALAVCEIAGVDRQTALEGMYAAAPDPGALRISTGGVSGRRWVFADAFAANDPESAAVLWETFLARFPDYPRRIAVLNCRSDRLDRSRQFGRLLAHTLRPDLCVLTGAQTAPAARAARAKGFDHARIVNLERAPAARVRAELMRRVTEPTLIVGMGNIRGVGAELAELLLNAEAGDG